MLPDDNEYENTFKIRDLYEKALSKAIDDAKWDAAASQIEEADSELGENFRDRVEKVDFEVTLLDITKTET